MRVDAYSKVAQLYQTNATKKMTKVASTSGSDQVELSSIGKDYQIAKQAVAKTADIRMDKVNDISKRIAAGTYNISAEEIADKILDSYFKKII